MAKIFTQQVFSNTKIIAKMERQCAGSWWSGSFDHYTFKSFVADKPHPLCIRDGRIGNLRVWNCNTGQIIAYYNGRWWGTSAQDSEDKVAVETLIVKLDQVPCFTEHFPELLQI